MEAARGRLCNGGWEPHTCTQWRTLSALTNLEALIGTPKIYTTTGFGPRKNREMAGVDDLVVYMQTAVFYSS